jgi:hypothetical protein
MVLTVPRYTIGELDEFPLRISLEFDHPFRSKLITRFGRS